LALKVRPANGRREEKKARTRPQSEDMESVESSEPSRPPGDPREKKRFGQVITAEREAGQSVSITETKKKRGERRGTSFWPRTKRGEGDTIKEKSTREGQESLAEGVTMAYRGAKEAKSLSILRGKTCRRLERYRE